MSHTEFMFYKKSAKMLVRPDTYQHSKRVQREIVFYRNLSDL